MKGYIISSVFVLSALPLLPSSAFAQASLDGKLKLPLPSVYAPSDSYQQILKDAQTVHDREQYQQQNYARQNGVSQRYGIGAGYSRIDSRVGSSHGAPTVTYTEPLAQSR
jgi:hypothetical protein